MSRGIQERAAPPKCRVLKPGRGVPVDSKCAKTFAKLERKSCFICFIFEVQVRLQLTSTHCAPSAATPRGPAPLSPLLRGLD